MDISYNLQGIEFEWNDEKAASNIQKHEVIFESACEIFFDPFLQSKDNEFIDGEQREIIIGATENFRLLYVAYTLRDDKMSDNFREKCDKKRKKRL